MPNPQVSSITVSLFSFMLPMISIDINVEEKLVSIQKFPETEAEIKTISNLRLFFFLNQLKRVKLSEWKQYYSNEMEILDGFRVIIMTVANSLRKSRVPDALPMFGTREYMSLSIL